MNVIPYILREIHCIDHLWFILFQRLDFDHAYIDETTNVVHEYYKLDSAVSGGEGQIVYGFDGATYDLKQVVLLPEGADESSAVYFTVLNIFCTNVPHL